MDKHVQRDLAQVYSYKSLYRILPVFTFSSVKGKNTFYSRIMELLFIQATTLRSWELELKHWHLLPIMLWSTLSISAFKTNLQEVFCQRCFKDSFSNIDHFNWGLLKVLTIALLWFMFYKYIIIVLIHGRVFISLQSA